MAELRGKGWRVVGYFLWMLGAGLHLDGGPELLARGMLAVGLLVFLKGAWQSWQSPAQWQRETAGEEPGSPNRP